VASASAVAVAAASVLLALIAMTNFHFGVTQQGKKTSRTFEECWVLV